MCDFRPVNVTLVAAVAARDPDFSALDVLERRNFEVMRLRRRSTASTSPAAAWTNTAAGPTPCSAATFVTETFVGEAPARRPGKCQE